MGDPFIRNTRVYETFHSQSDFWSFLVFLYVFSNYQFLFIFGKNTCTKKLIHRFSSVHIVKLQQAHVLRFSTDKSMNSLDVVVGKLKKFAPLSLAGEK